MKIICPKCKSANESTEYQCINCGHEFPGDLRGIVFEPPKNPLLGDAGFVGTSQVDPAATDSFGTIDLIPSIAPTESIDPKDSLGNEDQTVDFDSPTTTPIADIGTVDFDQSHGAALQVDPSEEELSATGLTAEIAELLQPSQPHADDPDGTVDFDDKSANSLTTESPVSFELSETLPSRGPNGTIVDGLFDQTIQFTDSQSSLDFDVEAEERVGPGGTVVDNIAGKTIDFSESAQPVLAEPDNAHNQDDNSRQMPTTDGYSNGQTVALENGTYDFDTATYVPSAGGTGNHGQDSTIQLASSLDFETSAPVSGAIPSSGTVSDESSSATIDVSLLGPSNRRSSETQFGTRQSASDSKDGLDRGSMSISSAPASHTGVSGTSGRVQRMWHGAGASQHQPGNTLKAAAQMASDEIFELVQPRVMVAEDMESLIRRGAKNDRERQLIEHCLTVACRHFSEPADYEINGFLGKGAMGVVLQARQKSIGRDVAIKMVQPPASSGAATVANTRDMHRKFLYEAQVTGKLDHPNIVPVYELGTSNGALFYSMKKISGVEWTKKLKQLTLEENLDVWMKVADAMAFSHQRNIIHRDLKPDNVMLGAFGEVLVTDWGCAVDLNTQKKFSGAGSPPWMAPEMALQQHDLLGPKSDMYLLGAILYQVVVGHPPHPGRTAMEALMAAARNQIIQVDNSDPLLEIAYRAMKTDLHERFENLEAMQEAIRQYRQHSESIAICQRCESTLASAIETSDYEKFSRSVFGFQDALELWPQNDAASGGLARARLAYGRCALSRKDYDLCLETLDRSVSVEEEVYQQALIEKQIADNREKRVQALRKSFFGAVTAGLAVAALLAAVAWIQRNDAVTQKELAESAAKSEKIAKEDAIQAREVAIEAANSERVARQSEQQAKEKAVAAQKAAEQSAESEREAKLQEQQAKVAAQTAQQAAEKAADAERVAKLEAQRRSAQIELASMRSNLALALNQVDKMEMARANESLQSVVDSQSYQALASIGLQPKMNNWAWQRVNLLSNRDLVQPAWAESITAFEFSARDQLGVMAVRDQGSHWLKKFRLSLGRLELIPNQQIEVNRPVTSLAILESGSTIAFTLRSASNTDQIQPSAFLWRGAEATLIPLSSVRNESLQQVSATGERSLVAGLNQGLWYWNDVSSADSPQRIRHIQGQLQSMQVVDSNQVVLLAETASQSTIHWVRLDQPNQKRFLRVASIAGSSVKPSAIAYHHGKIVLGSQSGKLYSFDYSSNDQTEQVISEEELRELPASHSSAVQSIRVHADGTLITTAREPIVRVWKPSQHASGWSDNGWLSGPTTNVGTARFGADSNQVIATAADATTTVWYIDQSRLRERIQYPSATDDASTNVAQRTKSIKPEPSEDTVRGSSSSIETNAISYDSPVVSVITSASGTTAVSILGNGRVDRWNPRTGRSTAGNALTHVGHDPNAELVDLDIDEAAGVMVTAAKLPSASLRSAPVAQAQPRNSNASSDSLRVWEFVKWDLRNGQMLDRWTNLESDDQPVSLVDGGRLILYGSDKKTVLQSSDSQKRVAFQSDEFGSYFSSVNPKNPTELMLVKLNGVVRVVDTRQMEQSWQQRGRQLSETDFHKLATKGDRVVLGRWAPTGDAYYLIWESGRITELSWLDGQLSLRRDLIEPGQRLNLSLQGLQQRLVKKLKLSSSSALSLTIVQFA